MIDPIFLSEQGMRFFYSVKVLSAIRGDKLAQGKCKQI